MKDGCRNSNPKNSISKKPYDKIGGWLILFATGLALYPVRNVISLHTKIVPLFLNESWTMLTTPGSAAYHPLWAPLLIFELAGTIFFTVFSITVLVFFFQRRKLAPNLTISFLLSNLIFVGVDFYLARRLPTATNSFNPVAIIDFTRTLVASGIWIPYFFFSKRVKATFRDD